MDLKTALDAKEKVSKFDPKLLFTPKGIIVLVLVGVIFLFALFNPLISIPVAFIAGFVTAQVLRRKKDAKNNKESSEV